MAYEKVLFCVISNDDDDDDEDKDEDKTKIYWTLPIVWNRNAALNQWLTVTVV